MKICKFISLLLLLLISCMTAKNAVFNYPTSKSEKEVMGVITRVLTNQGYSINHSADGYASTDWRNYRILFSSARIKLNLNFENGQMTIAAINEIQGRYGWQIDYNHDIYREKIRNVSKAIQKILGSKTKIKWIEREEY